METNNDWLNKQYDRIEEWSKDFSISKYNLLKISFLKRLLEESLAHSEKCHECKQNLSELEQMIDQIPLLDQIDHRQPYEKKFNAIRTHFHKKHDFIPPYFYSTRWTIAGIGVGIAVASLTSVLLKGSVLLDPVLAGFVLGLIIGYLIGSSKEARFRKTKKII